jgi:putative Mg2+ transporter-C (MgtC) family protein
MPSQSYAHHHIGFERDRVMPEDDSRKLLRSHGFTIANMNYRVTNDGRFFEYRMILRTTNTRNYAKLSDALRGLEQVREFKITPTGD